MINFVTAKTSNIYRTLDAKRNSKKIPLIYRFPEATLTEPELIDWVAAVVNDHVIHKNVLIYTNSSIVIQAFRAEVKEGRLKPEEFHLKFYEIVANRLEKFDVVMDRDGRVDYLPDGCFDSLRHSYRRLM